MWWKIEIVFSYLTGMGMLWLENCEKLLLTFFYWFISKYLCCSIQLVSASSPLELVPELRISAQELPHPLEREDEGKCVFRFHLFCFILFYCLSCLIQTFLQFLQRDATVPDCQYKDTSETVLLVQGFKTYSCRQCCNSSSPADWSRSTI